jgi:hypothetical protein
MTHRTQTVGRVSLFVTPWARAWMTDEEWETLRNLDLDASVHMFAASANGPFTIRLGREGYPLIERTRRTFAEAFASVVDAVRETA